MVVDEQDEVPEATQREAELQRQIDGLQSQVTELHKTQEETNPELSSEFQSLKEKLNVLGDFCVGSLFSLSEVFHFPGEGGDPGTGPGKLHSGEPWFLPAGILRPVSCLGSGGIQCLKDGKLWYSDGVLETVEPGALMFPKEELHALMCRG
ncbi:hypothetical protein F2Q70_00011715 [Brassica cretica]|uniref:Uncharacterized protein n=1 Tax=Brassica cretica TaxID=69181 RepID=A0A3N6QNX8_BRACR|nr:hypothetical protein F2Q70_00011715 [Brassica cretica]KAF3548325.1 hypothetical protein DY000_02007147 [Brassica cretica]